MTNIITTQQSNYLWQYDQHCFDDMSEHYFTAEYWQKNNAVIGQESGRGTTWFVQQGKDQLVLRHYLRGGMMRHLSRDKYLFSGYQHSRSISELNVLHALLKKKLPVPTPAAAQVIKHGFLYEADLLTHKIPHARDLIQVLRHPQSTDFYKQLGKMIATFHKEGVFHADMNIQNILQDKDGKFWLIDFDRARILTPNEKWQKTTLSRLKRSFEKEQKRFDIQWHLPDWDTFMQGYRAC